MHYCKKCLHRYTQKQRGIIPEYAFLTYFCNAQGALITQRKRNPISGKKETTLYLENKKVFSSICEEMNKDGNCPLYTQKSFFARIFSSVVLFCTYETPDIKRV